MKAQDFKNVIKEAVREAIQEELKDILLEAVRAPKAPIQEAYQMHPVTVNANTTPTPTISPSEKRAVMESIMGDMRRGQDTMSFTSNDARGMNATTMQVAPGAMPGGDLPSGNVGLDQIMGLMNKR
jgi:hypothetical protein